MIHKRIYFIIREQNDEKYVNAKFSLGRYEAVAVGSFKVGEVAIMVPQHLWVQRIEQAEFETYKTLELFPEYMNVVSDDYDDTYMWLPHSVNNELDTYTRIPPHEGRMNTHLRKALELCGFRLCMKTYTLTEA